LIFRGRFTSSRHYSVVDIILSLSTLILTAVHTIAQLDP